MWKKFLKIQLFFFFSERILSWLQCQHTTQSPRQDSASLQRNSRHKHHRNVVRSCFAWRWQPRGTEGNSAGQSPQINPVLRNKSLWHQQSPKEHFPSCSEQGPAGVPLTAPCRPPPPPQPKAAGERVLEGSCANSPSSQPELGGTDGDGPSWLQMPPVGQGPPSAGCLPHRPQGCAELLTCTATSPGKETATFPSPFLLKLATPGVQQYLADIWPLGFPDNDSYTHPGTAEPAALRRDITKGPAFSWLCKL